MRSKYILLLSLFFAMISCKKNKEFIYPESKDGVTNLLALESGTTITKEINYSLHVLIPKRQNLKVVITNLSDNPNPGGQIPIWFYTVFTDFESWVVGEYQNNQQIFRSTKKSEESYMKLLFSSSYQEGVGSARIDVYESSEEVTKSIIIYW